MREVVILGAGRSAGGKFGGSLAALTAPELGAVIVAETIKRSGIKPEDIDQPKFKGTARVMGLGPGNNSSQNSGFSDPSEPFTIPD